MLTGPPNSTLITHPTPLRLGALDSGCHRLRLGVGGIGSTPIGVLVLVVFIVAIAAGLGSLVLGSTNPGDKKQLRWMGAFMDGRTVVAAVLETVQATGVNLLAGLLPLT